MQAQLIPDYERRWVDALNRGDASIAGEIFAEDCLIHITGSPEPLHGPAAFGEMVQGLLTAFPDLHFTIEDQVSAGDKVAMRWTATGTHTGPLGQVPATAKSITIDGIILDRVVAGKVSERWEQWDQSRMLQQLGLA